MINKEKSQAYRNLVVEMQKKISYYIGDDEVRYVLGQPGNNNLLVIGVNPSTATPEEPDQTIKKVMEISKANGYGGWIMVNLYPQRSTNPNGMTFDQNLIKENL